MEREYSAISSTFCFSWVAIKLLLLLDDASSILLTFNAAKEEGNTTARSQRTESTEDDEYEIAFQTGPIGLKLFDKDGACCVLAIQPDSQADKAEDIAKGDIIVAINDTDVDGKPTTEINKMLKELPRPVRITFLMGEDED